MAPEVFRHEPYNTKVSTDCSSHPPLAANGLHNRCGAQLRPVQAGGCETGSATLQRTQRRHASSDQHLQDSEGPASAVVNQPCDLRLQVDVYAFSMIAYELFEGAIPFEHLHPVEAARRAAMNHARPVWGKTSNRLAPAYAQAIITNV